MKRKTYTEEQIIAILNEHEAGMPANERKRAVRRNVVFHSSLRVSERLLLFAQRFSPNDIQTLLL